VEQPTSALEAAVDKICAELAGDDQLSAQSLRRLIELLQAFAGWSARRRLSSLDAVGPEVARQFVESATVDGNPPSVATQHLRRSALRLLFRTARSLGLAASDPALDLNLPPRSSLALRPLTDDEIVLCRSCALVSLTATRSSAAWALAEATATTSEIPAVRVGDVDLGAGRVWLAGGSKREPRYGLLTDWGRAQIGRHLRQVGTQNADGPLVYRGAGSAESRQASSCQAIAATLVRAGLGQEPDIRPGSVAAWAGARLFAQGGRIEDVARAMGLRSLDQAARAIAWDWSSRDG
jgi:integrase/recombinase XerC